MSPVAQRLGWEGVEGVGRDVLGKATQQIQVSLKELLVPFSQPGKKKIGTSSQPKRAASLLNCWVHPHHLQAVDSEGYSLGRDSEGTFANTRTRV